MLIYLDIDGVMVPANSWRKSEILEDGFPSFSTKAVKSLNKILLNVEVAIVLITSHKHKYSLEEWINIFNRRNIAINKITRLPKNTSHLDRKNELMNWFDSEYNKGKFIIIDDDKSLNGLPSFLKDKLIQTSGSVGLTDYLADEALKKINEL